MLRDVRWDRHSDAYLVPMVCNVVKVLEAFRSNGPRLSLSQVIDLCGLPKTSAFRILESLGLLGYLSRDEKGHYRLTYRLLDVAMVVQDRSVLRRAAWPHLESLYRDKIGTVNLGLLESNQVVYAEVLETPRRLTGFPRPGSRGPLHATALGKAVAAWLPPGDLAVIVQQFGLPRFTERTISTEVGLQDDLARTRERGFAIDDGEVESGWVCVAAPIFDWRSRLPGAISVTTACDDMAPDHINRLGQKVSRYAMAISTELGSPVTFQEHVKAGFIGKSKSPPID